MVGRNVKEMPRKRQDQEKDFALTEGMYITRESVNTLRESRQLVFEER